MGTQKVGTVGSHQLGWRSQRQHSWIRSLQVAFTAQLCKAQHASCRPQQHGTYAGGDGVAGLGAGGRRGKGAATVGVQLEQLDGHTALVHHAGAWEAVLGGGEPQGAVSWEGGGSRQLGALHLHSSSLLTAAAMPAVRAQAVAGTPPLPLVSQSGSSAARSSSQTPSSYPARALRGASGWGACRGQAAAAAAATTSEPLSALASSTRSARMKIACGQRRACSGPCTANGDATLRAGCTGGPVHLNGHFPTACDGYQAQQQPGQPQLAVHHSRSRGSLL